MARQSVTDEMGCGSGAGWVGEGSEQVGKRKKRVQQDRQTGVVRGRAKWEKAVVRKGVLELHLCSWLALLALGDPSTQCARAGSEQQNAASRPSHLLPERQ